MNTAQAVTVEALAAAHAQLAPRLQLAPCRACVWSADSQDLGDFEALRAAVLAHASRFGWVAAQSRNQWVRDGVLPSDEAGVWLDGELVNAAGATLQFRHLGGRSPRPF